MTLFDWKQRLVQLIDAYVAAEVDDHNDDDSDTADSMRPYRELRLHIDACPGKDPE